MNPINEISHEFGRHPCLWLTVIKPVHVINIHSRAGQTFGRRRCRRQAVGHEQHDDGERGLHAERAAIVTKSCDKPHQ